MSKPWAGRFGKETAALVDEFGASLPFDRRLYQEEIAGSIAHAQMLAAQGIITLAEGEVIVAGLRAIAAEIERGEFVWRITDEDIHTAVEARLREKIGAVAGKLHTARSRNDQVALDMRLYARRACDQVTRGLLTLQSALLDQAEANIDVVMPGYTHTQRAQPVLFAHHLLAYVEMLERDRERVADCRRRLNLSPLGAGALAGTTFPIDREAVARSLGFDGLCRNSLDAVSDRDFVVEFLAAASLVMTHLSRLAEEIILWATAEFGFVTLDDAYATGSSMMPQKKNPDVAELVRGKAGRVYGHLLALLTTLKGLPLAYNKDLQEDKEGFFDACDTVQNSLAVFTGLIATLQVNRQAMAQAAGGSFTTATDLADYLTRRGVPFRQAHALVGRLVAYCLEQGKDFFTLSLDEYRQFIPAIEADVYQAISVEASVAARRVPGGTAPQQVRAALAEARRRVTEAGLLTSNRPFSDHDR